MSEQLYNQYLQKEDDGRYYSMNTLSFYYDDMARKQKLIEDMAKLIAGYDMTLTTNLTTIETLVANRMAAWDVQVNQIPATVDALMKTWIENGTIDTIINDTRLNLKADQTEVDTLTEQLNASQTEVDSLTEQLENKSNQNDVRSFKALKETLDTGTRSCGFGVIGDSTGNETWEWAYKFTQYLAARYPKYTVVHRLFDDVTQSFGLPTTLQVGTQGVSEVISDGQQAGLMYPSIHLANTLDVRVKVQTNDWTPDTTKMIVGQMGNVGFRSWSLGVTSTGLINFTYSLDGSGIATQNSSAALSVADGGTIWLRAVVTPNNGNNQRVFSFYQSTDGITWVAVGIPMTLAGSIALFDGHSENPLSGFLLGGNLVGSIQRWVGKIFEVEIRDGENGPLIAPALPSLWLKNPVNGLQATGAPVLTVVNGSRAGANIDYLRDSIRLPKLTPDYGQILTIISDSHNENATSGAYWLKLYDDLTSKIKARLPFKNIVVTMQNPQRTSASFSEFHKIRQADLFVYATSQNFGLINIFKTFNEYQGDWQVALMADLVHPNITGQQIWFDTLAQLYENS